MQNLNLSIDPLKLEVEWMNHPGVYGYWAEVLAETQSEYDEVKSAFDVTKATISQEIRENPSDFGLNKLTEAAIIDALPLDPRMKKAVSNVNAAKKKVALAKAAVDALEHKKRALTILAELWIKEYYSELGMPKAEHLTEDDKKAIRSRGRARRERDSNDDPAD